MPEKNSNGNITSILPFGNRGLVQKIDPSQLSNDQYSLLLNMVSNQEGSIRPRGGWSSFSPFWAGGTAPSFIHTMAVARPFGPQGDLITYIGDGNQIQRVKNTSPYSASSAIIEGSATATNRRGTYPIWKSDKSGANLMAYLATGEKMLRDNGSYNDARVWGINPPLDFCTAVPGGYDFVNIIKSGTFNGGLTLTDSRFTSDTVASVRAIVANTGADGYYAIVPTGGATTIDGLLVGMYLNVGGVDIRVDKIDQATNEFFAFFSAAPSALDAIEGYTTANIDGIGVSVDETSGAISANLAFDGSPDDGYDTEDNIHIHCCNRAYA